MSEDEKITVLMLLTGESNTAMLTYYLNRAKEIVMQHAYPYGTGEEEFPLSYVGVQLDVAVYLVNKRGAEGELSHNENGISRSYESGDVPSSLLRRIVPKAGVLK